MTWVRRTEEGVIMNDFDHRAFLAARIMAVPYENWEPVQDHERMWRGQDQRGLQWYFALFDGENEAWAVTPVSPEIVEYSNLDYLPGVQRNLENQIRRLKLPECIVPECGEKAPAQLHAAEHGKLAGHLFSPGDEIDLCPKHADDVYRAQGVYGLDELAEWLRPDAVLDPLDAFDAGTDLIHGSEIGYTRRRMIRVQTR